MADIKPGDIVQIKWSYERKGWAGAPLVVDEVKGWGVQGYVHVIDTHDTHSRAYLRLGHKDFVYVGRGEAEESA